VVHHPHPHRVDIRAPGVKIRTFAARRQAVSFSSRVGRLHFTRRIVKVGNVWHVRYYSSRWHPYRRVGSLRAAEVLAGSLRSRGLQTRIVRVG
jgi:hypothetical protein